MPLLDQLSIYRGRYNEDKPKLESIGHAIGSGQIARCCRHECMATESTVMYAMSIGRILSSRGLPAQQQNSSTWRPPGPLLCNDCGAWIILMQNCCRTGFTLVL
eukprot:5110223-Amphidinium_carterae.1